MHIISLVFISFWGVINNNAHKQQHCCHPKAKCCNYTFSLQDFLNVSNWV